MACAWRNSSIASSYPKLWSQARPRDETGSGLRRLRGRREVRRGREGCGWTEQERRDDESAHAARSKRNKKGADPKARPFLMHRRRWLRQLEPDSDHELNSRGNPLTSVTWPKFASPWFTNGPRKFGLFSALMTSNLTITFAPPPIRCVFWNARSSCFLNGVRTRSSVRGALPNVNGAASDHAAGFSQRETAARRVVLGVVEEGIDARTPRSAAARCRIGWSCCCSGTPKSDSRSRRSRRRPPPIRQESRPPAPLVAHRLPSPNGSSYAPVRFSRCGWSLTESVYSCCDPDRRRPGSACPPMRPKKLVS